MFEAESREDFLRHNVVDFYCNHSKRKQIIDTVIREGFIEDEEVEFVTSKGRRFWGSITLVKSEDSNGKVFFNGIVENISKRKEHEEQLKSLSVADELTKLCNRRGFLSLAEHQLKIARRQRKDTALFFIDLDNMKQINDSLGHKEGDRALIDTADIIKKASRESDVVARLGGDEFVVLATGVNSKKADIFANRLIRYLNDYNAKGDRPYELSMSIGTADCGPVETCSVEGLLEEADRLMYRHKLKKKNMKDKEGV